MSNASSVVIPECWDGTVPARRSIVTCLPTGRIQPVVPYASSGFQTFGGLDKENDSTTGIQRTRYQTRRDKTGVQKHKLWNVPENQKELSALVAGNTFDYTFNGCFGSEKSCLNLNYFNNYLTPCQLSLVWKDDSE